MATPFAPPARWMDFHSIFDIENVCPKDGTFIKEMPFPFYLTTGCTTNNNAAGLLLPDNDTLLQMQPLYRHENGGDFYAWYHFGAPQAFLRRGPLDGTSIRGDGTWGVHGGS